MVETPEKPEVTPDIIISASLVDRIAGLMVVLQRGDPKDMLQFGQLLERINRSYQEFMGQWLADRKTMFELSKEIQLELQKIRGPWGVCHLCKPPKRIETKDLRQHDISIHGAYKG